VVERACRALLGNPRQPCADGPGPPTQPLRHCKKPCSLLSFELPFAP
jgi:hypothetical protein